MTTGRINQVAIPTREHGEGTPAACVVVALAVRLNRSKHHTNVNLQVNCHYHTHPGSSLRGRELQDRQASSSVSSVRQSLFPTLILKGHLKEAREPHDRVATRMPVNVEKHSQIR